MARHISDVIDQMLEVVPAEEAGLIGRLKKARFDAGFAAPEMQGSVWRKVQAILVREIGEPRTAWQFRVAAIFSTGE